MFLSFEPLILHKYIKLTRMYDIIVELVFIQHFLDTFLDYTLTCKLYVNLV